MIVHEIVCNRCEAKQQLDPSSLSEVPDTFIELYKGGERGCFLAHLCKECESALYRWLNSMDQPER